MEWEGMRVGDVKKWLPKDDDEEIIIAWWEYGDGESWPEWLTEKVWKHYVDQICSNHDWSYEHEAICDHFDSLRQYEPMTPLVGSRLWMEMKEEEE
mgnify:CR=1 FL=1